MGISENNQFDLGSSVVTVPLRTDEADPRLVPYKVVYRGRSPVTVVPQHVLSHRELRRQIIAALLDATYTTAEVIALGTWDEGLKCLLDVRAGRPAQDDVSYGMWIVNDMRLPRLYIYRGAVAGRSGDSEGPVFVLAPFPPITIKADYEAALDSEIQSIPATWKDSILPWLQAIQADVCDEALGARLDDIPLTKRVTGEALAGFSTSPRTKWDLLR